MNSKPDVTTRKSVSDILNEDDPYSRLYWLSVPALFLMYVWHRPKETGFVGELSRFLHQTGPAPELLMLGFGVLVSTAAIILLFVTVTHFLLEPGAWLTNLPARMKSVPDERSTYGVINCIAAIALAWLLRDYRPLSQIVIIFFGGTSVMILHGTLKEMGLLRFLDCVFMGLLVCIGLNRLFGRK